MPKLVGEELGVARTDVGCLGYGVYFSDSASTSLKYTTASTVRPGRRLLCICQVALGETADFHVFSPTLTKPPTGFHSTHGVKRTEDHHSTFTVSVTCLYCVLVSGIGNTANRIMNMRSINSISSIYFTSWKFHGHRTMLSISN